MYEKSLIFGVSDVLEGLIIEMIKSKIDLDLENDYYLNISPPPIHESEFFFKGSVISGIFIDVNERLLNSVINWLQSQKILKNPKLKLVINGNLLNIDIYDMKMLLKILKECSSEK